ncbi:MAG: hypothetical protein KJ052_00650 [Candidatus Hydrogenedentes bacterium]|nr:hypothetical protein [Candidatus Hydrogenedentota bacterium]
MSFATLEVPDNITLYYISAEDGDVYRTPLDAADSVKVFDLNSVEKDEFEDPDTLAFLTSSENSERVDLVAVLWREDQEMVTVPVVEDVAPASAVAEISDREKLSWGGWWGNYAAVSKLGAASDSPWQFNAGGWALEGLRGTNEATGARARFSVELPVARWPIRKAVQLPGDNVLFQLGPNQICLYDPIRDELALVAKGRQPVLVLGSDKE